MFSNETANQFSVSSGQLANLLGIVSSALSVGGNSFEEVIGLNIRSSKNSLIDGEPLRALYTNLF